MKKLDLRQLKHLCYALMALAFLMVMVAYCLHSMRSSVAAGVCLCVVVVLCVAAVIIELALWRCPHCGERPGRLIDGPPKFCPCCGKQIEDFK